MSYLTDPTQQCRDISTLEAITEARVRAWLKAVDAKYDVIVTETRRTRARQQWLFASGRTRRGDIVTFVSGDQSFHRFEMAVDVCPIVKGKVAYNLLGKIFKEFPPTRFGLAVLNFEKAHLQRNFPGNNPNQFPASSAAKLAGLKPFNP